MAAITSAILGGLAIAGSVGSYFEQKKTARKQERAQEKSNRISQVSAQVENARQRRRAIAQARIAQARNMAQQSNTVESSSALSGVQGSISAQLGANIGAQNMQIGNQIALQNVAQRYSDIGRRGAERAGLWQLGGQFAEMGFNQSIQGLGKTSPSPSRNPAPYSESFLPNNF